MYSLRAFFFVSCLYSYTATVLLKRQMFHRWAKLRSIIADICDA